MTIQLDNNQRVFQVVTSVNHQVFCNLHHLNDVIEELGTHEGYFKIYHFWDHKAKVVSKKLLGDMFKANKIEPTFFY